MIPLDFFRQRPLVNLRWTIINRNKNRESVRFVNNSGRSYWGGASFFLYPALDGIDINHSSYDSGCHPPIRRKSFCFRSLFSDLRHLIPDLCLLTSCPSYHTCRRNRYQAINTAMVIPKTFLFQRWAVTAGKSTPKEQRQKACPESLLLETQTPEQKALKKRRNRPNH